MDALSMCKLADNTFNMTDIQLKWLARELLKDFSDIAAQRLNNIIINGIKGAYSEGGRHFQINSRVIYEWVRVALGRNVSGMNFNGTTTISTGKSVISDNENQ